MRDIVVLLFGADLMMCVLIYFVQMQQSIRALNALQARVFRFRESMEREMQGAVQ